MDDVEFVVQYHDVDRMRTEYKIYNSLDEVLDFISRYSNYNLNSDHPDFKFKVFRHMRTYGTKLMQTVHTYEVEE